MQDCGQRPRIGVPSKDVYGKVPGGCAPETASALAVIATVTETEAWAAPAALPADAAFLVHAPGNFDAYANRYDNGSCVARGTRRGSVHRVL